VRGVKQKSYKLRIIAPGFLRRGPKAAAVLSLALNGKLMFGCAELRTGILSAEELSCAPLPLGLQQQAVSSVFEFK
jgi:hypothetical protein